MFSFRFPAIILLFATVICLSGLSLASSHGAVIYTFRGDPDCGTPLASLVEDQQGNLYGTTVTGGTYNQGCVFKLSRSSQGGWSETVLYSFQGPDGASPSS